LGKSGSGKSTLLNLLSGLERPDEGEVLVDGQSLNALDDTELSLLRRNKLGFVFQFFNLLPTLTVKENLLLPLELSRKRKNPLELLQRVGLEDRADAFPDRLSGGEQQRVAVARALIHDPVLVLADEPTGNLDETTGRQVLDLLVEMTRGKTLLMVTHNLELAQRADRTLQVVDGQLQ
jgi:putative ABC transport system ATP-binding protein